MNLLDTIAKENGFESEKEMHKLIANVDLSDPIKLNRFETWKQNDGTKTGLLELLENKGA